MNFILTLNLDMLKMYLYTENEVPSFSASKVIAWTDRQIDRQTDRQNRVKLYADGNKTQKRWFKVTRRFGKANDDNVSNKREGDTPRTKLPDKVIDYLNS